IDKDRAIPRKTNSLSSAAILIPSLRREFASRNHQQLFLPSSSGRIITRRLMMTTTMLTGRFCGDRRAANSVMTPSGEKRMKVSSSFFKRVLCAAAFSLLFTTAPGYAAEGLQKLRVAYAAITAAFSIPWIAKEAGIFQRHGLDVELVYIASGSRAVQTLVGGSIDVAAIGGPAGVDAKLAGADTVYIAIPVNRVLVFTVAEPHVQRVEELRGKSIGV